MTVRFEATLRRRVRATVTGAGLVAVAVAGAALGLPPAHAADSWSTPVDVSAALGDATTPQIVSSADGSKLTIVWSNFDGNDYVIQTASSSDGGSTWTLPVTLSGPNATTPQVAGSADGSKLTAVWARYTGANIIIQSTSSVDGGATWSSAMDLSLAGGDAENPAITSSADGARLTVTWNRNAGAPNVIQAITSSDGGTSWSNLTTVSTGGGAALSPSLAGSADGSAVTVTWSGWNGSDYVIRAASTVNGGINWSNQVDLSLATISGQSASGPQITSSADGSALTATWWWSYDGIKYVIQAASSSDGGGTWSAPVSLSATGQNALYPQITGSSDGSKVAITWLRFNGANNIAQVASTIDGGANWSAPTNLSADGQDALLSRIASSADGSRITAVWRYNGVNNVIQSSSSSDSGATWSSPTTLTAAGQSATNPEIAGSADGTTFTAAWVRLTGVNGIIQASSSTAAPAPQPPAPAYPPSAPRSVTAEAGDASASVSWQAPESAGSFPISTYQVQASPGGKGCLIPATQQSCVVTGLTNGTTYAFTVRALNGAGWGSVSAASNSITPQAPPARTLLITGSRGTGADAGRVVVTGRSTGLAGKQATPWTRFPGQTDFVAGSAAKEVGSAGSFTWQRKTGKKISVYFIADTVRSNPVTIPAR